MDLTIELTSEVPTHMIIVSVEDDGVRVRCSPKVDAEALAALHPEIANAIADRIDAAPQE